MSYRNSVSINTSEEMAARVASLNGERLTVAHLRDFTMSARAQGIPDEAEIYLGSISAFVVRWPAKNFLTWSKPAFMKRGK